MEIAGEEASGTGANRKRGKRRSSCPEVVMDITFFDPWRRKIRTFPGNRNGIALALGGRKIAELGSFERRDRNALEVPSDCARDS